MINSEFLASCNPEEIDRGVVWCLASKTTIRKLNYFNADKYFTNRVFVGSLRRWFNPCQSANDIMPIAFANKIGLLPPENNSWEAVFDDLILEHSYPCYRLYAENTNPLRAICEVYILMSVA
jgi:hypothetical protein